MWFKFMQLKKMFIKCCVSANRLVVNAASLKPTSFGFAGSNPASCKIFILIITFGLLLIIQPILYYYAYFHINSLPFDFFKCVKIVDLGMDVFLEAALTLIYSFNKLLFISYCLILVPSLLSFSIVISMLA